MKRLFVMMAMTAVVFATSCKKDDDEQKQEQEQDATSYAVGDFYPNTTTAYGIVAYVDASHDNYDASTKRGTEFIIMGLDEYLDTRDDAQSQPPTTGGLTWYLPTIQAWSKVVAGISGIGDKVTTTPSSNWISIDADAWEYRAGMPQFNDTTAARASFNTKIAYMSGTQLNYGDESDESVYWSSTDVGEATYVYVMQLYNGEIASRGMPDYTKRNIRYFSNVTLE